MEKQKTSFKKKLENYWYYYRIHTFVAVFILIVVAVSVQQCATKVDPDITVVVATNEPVLAQDNQDRLQKYIESLTADVNKDGKKSAQCDVLYFKDAQTAEAMQAKLAIDMMPSSGVYLFITDDTEYQQLKTQGLFGRLSEYLPGVQTADDDRAPLSQTKLGAAEYSHAFDNLSISLKAYKGNSSGDKKYAANIQNSLNALKSILAGKADK